MVQLTAAEAYERICRLLEVLNAFASSLYAAERFAEAAEDDDDDDEDDEADQDAAAASPEGAGGAGPEVAGATELDAGGPETAASGSGTAASSRHEVKMDVKQEQRLLFDPVRGNVVFASAYHGWAFTCGDFAEWWAVRLPFSRKRLQAALWGDTVYSSKGGGEMRQAKATATAASYMAVDMMLGPVWRVYETAEAHSRDPDKAARKLSRMAGKLGVALDPKAVGSRAPAEDRAPALLRAWLPLAPCVLGVAASHLPCPREAGPRRAVRLVPRALPGSSPALVRALHRCRAAIAAADPSPSAPVIAYASKVFAVSDADLRPHEYALPPREPMPLSALQGVDVGFGLADLSVSRFQALSAGGAPEAASGGHSTVFTTPEEEDDDDDDDSDTNDDHTAAGAGAGFVAAAAVGGSSSGAAVGSARDAESLVLAAPIFPSSVTVEGPSPDGAASETLLAFVRVFSGTLSHSTPVMVLGPRYRPDEDPARFAIPRGSPSRSAGATPTITAPVGPLPIWMMMAREMQPLGAVAAGNVAAIGGLHMCIIKSATVSSIAGIAPLASLTMQTTPLVRVTVQPRDAVHTTAVGKALQLLQQGDPCVEVDSSASGDVQIACLGPLHLERCLVDLRTRFCPGVELLVGPPIVPFRETIAAAATPSSGKRFQAKLATVAAATNVEPGSTTGSGGDFRQDEAGDPAEDASAASSGSAAVGVAWEASHGAPESPLFAASGRAIDPENGSAVAMTHDGSLAVRMRALPLPPALASVLSSPAGARLGEELRALRRLAGTAGAAAAGGAAAAAGGAAADRGPLSETEAGHAGGPLSTEALATLRALLAAAVEAGGSWVRRLKGLVALGRGEAACTMLCAVPPPPAAPDGGGTVPPWESDSSSVSAEAEDAEKERMAGEPPVPGASASDSGIAGVDWRRCRWVAMLQSPRPGAESTSAVSSSLPFASRVLRLGLRLDSLWDAAGATDDLEAALAAITEADSDRAATNSRNAEAVSDSGGVAADRAAAVDAAKRARAIFGVAPLASLAGSLEQGFRLAAETGPLCGEPVWGVCFQLTEVLVRCPPQSSVGEAAPPRLPAPGRLIAAAKEACTHAVRRGAMRLVEGWLRCQLTCSSGRVGGGEQMGSMYAVIARRRGRVLDERILEGTTTFLVEAALPMEGATGFADELRSATSGAATSPQLVFLEWLPLDEDPFFRPTTESELEEFGDRVHEGQYSNTARRLVKEIRRRKGLDSDRRIVVAAEKQRTLARKK